MELLKDPIKLIFKDISTDSELAVIANESLIFSGYFTFELKYMDEMKNLLSIIRVEYIRDFMRLSNGLYKIGTELSNLREISIISQNISELSDSSIRVGSTTINFKFPTFNNVKDIILQYNSISDFEHLSLSKFPNLKLIDLYINELTSLRGMPYLTNLKEVHLNYNFLDSLEGLPSLPRLKKLYIGIQSRHLSYLGQMPELKRLRILDLSGNSLETLKGMPDELPELIELNLEANELRLLTGISEMPKLEELNLSNNPISDGAKHRIRHKYKGVKHIYF